MSTRRLYGKQPGERVAGEKTVIGPRAQRLYEEKKAKGARPIAPMPDGMNCDIDWAPARERRPAKTSDLLIGTLALASTALVAAKKVRDEFKRSA